jgi:hypothetical protein
VAGFEPTCGRGARDTAATARAAHPGARNPTWQQYRSGSDTELSIVISSRRLPTSSAALKHPQALGDPACSCGRSVLRAVSRALQVLEQRAYISSDVDSRRKSLQEGAIFLCVRSEIHSGRRWGGRRRMSGFGARSCISPERDPAIRVESISEDAMRRSVHLWGTAWRDVHQSPAQFSACRCFSISSWRHT